MEPQLLVDQGLAASVAQRVSEIFASGLLSPEELDDRAFEALREFNEQGALEVLDQFANSDLSHVQNKSAFLCGVMKTYVTKSSTGGDTTATNTASNAEEAKIKALLERTGYTLDITAGQRKYGGPPPGWEGPAPGTGGSEKGCCQVFVGKIPRECFEDEIIPLLEECGQIYDFRLMMDPASGLNRGFGFCTFATKAQAQNAVKKLDNKEIQPGRKLGVCISVANNRLFVGSIPKSKTKQDIFDEFSKVTSDLTDVIVYLSAENKGRNRGFAFLEFESHKAAALAKRRLESGKVYVWGSLIAKVEWADPQEEPDEEVMAKVKVVYVRNISPNITEEKIQEEFSQFGTVDRVKKLKDYAFVHFSERESAMNAIEAMHNQVWDDIAIDVSLAKPQPANKDKRRGGGAGMGSRGNFSRGGGPRGRGRGQGGYSQGYQGYDNSGGYDSYGGNSNYDDGSNYDSYYGGGGGGDYSYGGYSDAGYGDGGYGGSGYGGGSNYSSRGGGRGGPRGGPRGAPRGGPRGGSRGGPRGGQRGGPRGAPRGGRGGPRGAARGGRGGDSGRGAGGRGGRGGPPRGRGGGFGPQKRKFGGDSGGGYQEAKRPYMDYSQQDYGQQEQQWGQDYSYGDQGEQWYQDSYSQQQWY